MAEASSDLAVVLQRSGRLDEAHQAFETAGLTWDTLVGRQPNDRAHRRGQALFLANHASFLATRGELAEGLRLAAVAVGQLRALAATDPRDAGAQRDLFLGNVRFASVARSARRFDPAIEAARSAVEVAETLVAREPDNPGRDRDVLAARSTLAEILEEAGRRAEAVALLKSRAPSREPARR